MISTVTTATAAAVSNLALVGVLSLVAVATLILLLVVSAQKEILVSIPGGRGEALARTLRAAIVPLLMVFACVVLSRLL